MTTQDAWHTKDGTAVYSASEIHQPYAPTIEDAFVVELADYQATETLFAEAVDLLIDAHAYMELGCRPADLELKINNFLATQDV